MADKLKHVVWYDHDERMWVSQWKDGNGNQVGNANWYPTKALAKEERL
jgi:hypothetical protein